MDSMHQPITSDDLMVVLDSGSSLAISNDANDFVGPMRPVQDVTLKGIASGLSVKGFGTVAWTFLDEHDEEVRPSLLCAHVPDSPTRLLPPQQLSQQEGASPTNGAWITGNSTAKVFYEGHCIDFPHEPSSNLPMAKLAPGCDNHKACCNEIKQDSPEPPTDNLSNDQRTLLRLHHRLGHRGFSQLQQWSKLGMNGIPKGLDKCSSPVCSACQHGAAKMRPHDRDNTASLVGKPTKPGEFMSVDQMISGSPGLIPFTSGRKSKRRHQLATLWVDHCSRHLHASCQESTSAKATLESKTDFETMCRRCRINIDHMHSDNGIFSSKTFRDHCNAMGQTQSFAGVGAHWQNGVVERHIGVITTRARTMLLHAMSKWSKVTSEFWTFAFLHAVRLHNVTPRPGQDKSPHTLFTDEDSPLTPKDFRTFGCPVYVLNKNLQDGASAGKWNERSYQGIYVGHSPNHASNVVMVFNPKTGLVSPQCHCVFDEDFLSVSPTDESSDDMDARIDSMFSKLFSDQIWEHTDDCSDVPTAGHLHFDNSWDLESLEAQQRAQREHESRINDGSSLKRSAEQLSSTSSSCEGDSMSGTLNGTPTPKNGHSKDKDVPSTDAPHEGASASSPSNALPTATNSQQHSQTDPVPQSNTPNESSISPVMATTTDDAAHDSPESASFPNTMSQLSHASLPTNKRRRLHGEFHEVTSASTLSSNLQSLIGQFQALEKPEPFTDNSNPSLDFATVQEVIDRRNLTFDGVSIDGFHNPDNPIAFAAAAAAQNPDMLTQSQMLKADDSAEFVKTQVPEVNGLVDAGVFEFLDSSDVPKDNRLLNATWSHRRKRRPDGSLLKHKSRICVDGSRQQHGIDCWNTHAPVCHWSTVRLMLVLAAVLGLASRQVDCAQAFPQAPLDDDAFVKTPQGFRHDPTSGQLEQVQDNPAHKDSRHCIKLKRNLHGCKQAARNWFLFLKEGLLSRGFVQSSVDPCLFIRHDAITVLCTDDCCIFGQNQDIITSLCSDLQQDFLLTDEGDIESFLGTQINKRVLPDSDSVETTMSQPGLIDQIIADVGLDKPGSHGKFVPAQGTLHSPQESDHPFSAPWNYRSLVGKLNFLAQNTRPDTSMAVHQCARFVSNPQLRHQEAAKCLVRHLTLTRKRGLIFTPEGPPSLDAHVDGDFAGVWSTKTTQLRDSAVSRTGCVISCCGCPVHWVSKLQSEIALSSTEAEYVALSMCMRDLIPMRTLLFELTDEFRIDDSAVPLAPAACKALTRHHRSAVWEDDAGCLELAMNPEQHRPRTKHIGVKWHHFRDHISKGNTIVKKIDTSFDWADLPTEPLTRGTHERIRKLFLGW